MANTYTQIHIQAVFAVKYRQALIRKDWKAELYKYMTGIIQNHNHKVLQINGVEDHIHILFGMRPDESLSFLIQQVKRDSSKWINKQRKCERHFQWQGGFGAFSYSKSQIPVVSNYIINQERHHKKKSFIEEYQELLEKHEIEYDDAYIFKPLL